MSTILDRVRREPARVVGLVLALIALASAFGLNLSQEQSAAITAVVGAVLALGGAEVIRSQVTPVDYEPRHDA